MKKLQDSCGLRRMLAWVLGLSLVAAVAGCGGSSGAGAQGSLSAAAGASAAATITVVTDKSTLKSDGSQTATLTLFVKDANNNILPKQAVQLSTDDSASSISPGASPFVTDSTGKATAVLDVGRTNINRTVNVTARTGTLSSTLAIPVSGTTVAIVGGPTVALGTSGNYVVTLRNPAGTALPGVVIPLTSSNGNRVTATSGTTDASGQAQFSVVGANVGADTLAVSVLGASAQLPITVAQPASVSGLSFTPETASVPVNTPTPLTVTYTVGSVPQANKSLTLSLTRGSFVATGTSSQSVVTNSSGQATFSVISPVAGSSTVSGVDAADSSVTSSATLTFFSGPANATKINLSPSITSVGINVAGAQTNRSTLTAVVRDAADNPVSGATVAFSALVDPSGGSISPATAITDATGTATTSFIAGANSTGFNGVTLQAIVATSPSVTAQAQLTVAAVALYVDLGTGNTVGASADFTRYIMPWTAIVTDSSRAGVAGQTVTVSLTTKRYFKGVWAFNGTNWVPVGVPNNSAAPSGARLPCVNEDLNNNNILDAGEDKNFSNRLEAGSPASVTVNGTTAADGTTLINITYPQSFGGWVEVTLRATIGTSGSESSAEQTFVLPARNEETNSASKAPPNVGSFSLVPTTVVPNIPQGLYLTGPYGFDATTDANGFCTVNQ